MIRRLLRRGGEGGGGVTELLEEGAAGENNGVVGESDCHDPPGLPNIEISISVPDLAGLAEEPAAELRHRSTST